MNREQAVQTMVSKMFAAYVAENDGTPGECLDAILAVEQSGDGWVDVQKELPRDGQEVWTAVKRKYSKQYDIRQAVYAPTSDYPFSGDGPSVKFWMPRKGKPAAPVTK